MSSASKIDERIVQMSFENREFQKGIQESSKTLSEFDKTLANAGQSNGLSNLGSAAASVANKFDALRIIATTAISNIVNQAINAGQQLIKSLAIDPIMQGYNEYELKINSIKTILASAKTAEGLPVTLDEVNKQLQKLNEYSDQTIYSFADMTKNIGKFTNAGVDLDKSVNSIKGIANAAALSGANAEEASRAMYNFAQALSGGYVKLVDWKSIELANMATVEFKQQLLDAAVAAGTVEKTADGMYQVLTTNAEGKTMKMAISATKNFNESLEYQWMTTEVLTDTLNDYADATTAIGKKATEAATKVRTWSQLMDTTKEAVGSGWSETFEILIGGFDEATNLYTDLNGVIGDFVKTSSDARNQILSDWKALGGRTQIIIGIREAWRALSNILKPIREAFANVFPPLTGETLFRLSLGFKEFFQNIKIGPELAEKLKTIFQGLFSIIPLGWEGLKFVFNIIVHTVKELFSLLPPGAGDSILDFAVKIGQFFIDLKASTDKSEFFVSKTEEVKNAITKFVNSLKESIKTLNTEGIKGLPKVINDIITSFSKLFSGKATQTISANNGDNIFTRFTKQITDFINKIKPQLEKFKPLLAKISEFLSNGFEKIKEALSGVWNLKNLDDLTSILQKIAILVLTGGAIDQVKKLISSFSKIVDGFGSGVGNVNEILNEVKGTFKAYQEQLKAKVLMQIASAIALLTASLVVLAMVDANRLTAAGLAITVLFANLSASFILLEKYAPGNKLNLLAIQLLGLAASIGLMAISLAIISRIKSDALERSLVAISVITGVIAAFAYTMSKLKASTLLGVSLALNLMAIALLNISNMVLKIGDVEPEKLKQGLVGLAAIFGEIIMLALVLKKVSSSADSFASALMLFAISDALKKMGESITTFGNMKSSNLVQGLMAVTTALGILLIAMKLMATPNVLAGAAAMAIMTGSILLLTPAIILLGKIPIEELGIALLALAGVFTIIGIAGLVLAPITPAIIALAGALALLGVAVFAIGVGLGVAALGIGVFSLGLTALVGIGAAGVATLVAIVSGLAMLIPLVLKKFAEGMVQFAKVIGDGAPIIAKAITDVIANLIVLLTNEIPKFITAVLTFVGNLLQQLLAKTPEFVDAGMKIILAFLTGIEQNIQPIVESSTRLITNYLNGITNELPKLIKAGADILIAFMQGMAEQEPRVVDAAFKMIVSFINGLANAIRDNTPTLLDAIKNLCTAFMDGVFAYFEITEDGSSAKGSYISTAIIQGMINGIFPMTGPAVTALVNLGQAMIDGFKKLFQIASPSGLMLLFGTFIVQGLINGILSLLSKIDETVKNLMTRITQPFRDNVKNYLDVGKNIAQGIIDGLKSKIDEVVETVKELADTALEAIKDFLEIASPSKATTRFGKFFGAGFGNGVLDSISQVVDKVKTFGKTTLDTMSSTTSDLATSLTNNLLNDAPVITPVLDLSAIKSGANSLANLLNQGQTYNLAQTTASSTRQFSGRNQNENSNIDSSTTIENNITIKELAVRNDADVDAIAEKLHQKQQSAMRGKGLQTVFS